MTNRLAPVHLTPAAVERVKHLIAKREKSSVGVRVSIKTKGCSGLTYAIEYADRINPLDEIVEQDGVKILIDPKAVLFLIGSEMDFVQDKLQSGFTFTNPNEKGRCGCGKSFHI